MRVKANTSCTSHVTRHTSQCRHLEHASIRTAHQHVAAAHQLQGEGGLALNAGRVRRFTGGKWTKGSNQRTEEQSTERTEEPSNIANASSSCSGRPPDRLSIGSTERASPHSAANSSTARTDFPPPLPRFRCRRVSAARACSGGSCLHLP